LCKAGGTRQEVDSRDEVMHSEMRMICLHSFCYIFSTYFHCSA